MIQIKDDVVFDELLTHIGEQRVKARLMDEPFDLGIATDQKYSQILELVTKKEDILKTSAWLKEHGTIMHYVPNFAWQVKSYLYLFADHDKALP